MTLKLSKHPTFVRRPGPLYLIVMDGIGIGRQDEGDAVFRANTPTFTRLDAEALKCSLFAHGTHVGMPSDDDMGNSEVGHNALGAGRIFSQGASLVEHAVQSGAIFESKVWREMVGRCLERKSSLHFIGLLSDGNVHSHIEHLFAMLRQAAGAGVERVRVHPLLDGRDVGSTSALDYVGPTEALLAELSHDGRDYRIGSGGGRMHVTMDRYEADWRIVERGWQAHVLGQARQFASTTEAIETFRRETPGISDQVLPPFVIAENGAPIGTIEDGDCVVFFNFRGDRAIEISKCFEYDDMPHFERQRRPEVLYAGMMQYDGDTHLPSHFLVPPPAITETMGEYMVAAGMKTLAAAETQKYGHMTYFWNGNRSGYFDEGLECYLEVPSDKLDFSLRPWMKAAELTDLVIEETSKQHFDLVRINYANGDMVGHTGNLDATLIAVETVDLCLGRLLRHVAAQDGMAIITADHGNADQMYQLNKKKGGFALDAEGKPVSMTAHTLNPVPFWVWDPRGKSSLQLDPSIELRRLSNVAATALMLLGFERPESYDPSLLRFG
ncbi:MAG: 2,3-bisphosphoglycerate-independent phosphoglycerate mutase [Myxococcota bacterium]|jgi:2,3-bisphosphoglycerate-independent phosphoglycerate mutase|nr:2,3-bisphosphoglycerate-independent phosphoglycerate mutase [Myxococcota bacterium]